MGFLIPITAVLTLLNIWEEVCVREKRRYGGGQTYFGNIKFPDKLQTATTFPYCQYQDLHSMYNLAACLQFFVSHALIPHDMLHICQRFILVKNFVFSNLYNLFKTLTQCIVLSFKNRCKLWKLTSHSKVKLRNFFCLCLLGGWQVS